LEWPKSSSDPRESDKAQANTELEQGDPDWDNLKDASCYWNTVSDDDADHCSTDYDRSGGRLANFSEPCTDGCGHPH
jgi:hypothetical protein